MQYPFLTYGTFSTNLTPEYRYGLPLAVKMGGVVMDIDKILHTKVEVNNDREKLTAYNLSRGPSYSLNENLVPEQLFNNPDTPEKEADGISATKALGLAAQQGQTIYTVTKASYAEVLPKLNHSDVVMTDIRNGVNAGKTVTVHDTQITLNGWSGTGYTILDPESGAGAYMIGGGLDGGATVIKDSRDIGFSFTALMPNFGFIDNETEILIGHLATVAHVVKLSIIQINKFFRCNRELVINIAVAIGIAVIIALLLSGEAASLGGATPVVAPAILALIAILPASANANTLNTNSDCKSQCLFANENNIRAVLGPTTELTLQRSVSLPAIQRYVERFENGEKNIPPIKVDGNIIVDGNHRFVTGKLCKSEVPKIAGNVAPSQIPLAYPIRDIKIDILDWGNK